MYQLIPLTFSLVLERGLKLLFLQDCAFEYATKEHSALSMVAKYGKGYDMKPDCFSCGRQFHHLSQGVSKGHIF